MATDNSKDRSGDYYGQYIIIEASKYTYTYIDEGKYDESIVCAPSITDNY